VLLAGVVEVNALAQGVLRRSTQWLCGGLNTQPLRGGHFTTELLPHPQYLYFLHYRHYAWEAMQNETAIKRMGLESDRWEGRG